MMLCFGVAGDVKEKRDMEERRDIVRRHNKDSCLNQPWIKPPFNNIGSVSLSTIVGSLSPLVNGKHWPLSDEPFVLKEFGILGSLLVQRKLRANRSKHLQ
jgi:hypothetical protein